MIDVVFDFFKVTFIMLMLDIESIYLFCNVMSLLYQIMYYLLSKGSGS